VHRAEQEAEKEAEKEAVSKERFHALQAAQTDQLRTKAEQESQEREAAEEAGRAAAAASLEQQGGECEWQPVDDHLGRTYYWHTKTDRVTWEKADTDLP
jgi:hypothetical protein